MPRLLKLTAIGAFLRAVSKPGLELLSDTLNLRMMTCISISPALTRSTFAELFAMVRGMAHRLPVRDMFVAALLVLSAAAIVHAEENLQDWIPDVLVMPDDAEVVTDRAIGSTVRMLSIATNSDVDVLFAEWAESLETGGYPVVENEGDVLENSIEFSGPGISNAKIILAPATEDGRNLIEFDATLN